MEKENLKRFMKSFKRDSKILAVMLVNEIEVEVKIDSRVIYSEVTPNAKIDYYILYGIKSTDDDYIIFQKDGKEYIMIYNDIKTSELIGKEVLKGNKNRVKYITLQ